MDLSSLPAPLQPRLPRDLLRAPLQVRVRVANRTCDSVEGKARGLGRKLDLSADVEESKVAVDEVVGDTSCLILQKERSVRAETRKAVMVTYIDVDLATQDIFCLFESVVCRECGTGLDLVEA